MQSSVSTDGNDESNFPGDNVANIQALLDHNYQAEIDSASHFAAAQGTNLLPE